MPLLDPKVVSPTFETQQQVRAYYSVSDVLDVDRYEIDGKERALVLGVRELEQSGLGADARNWSNLHTVYTHGNGVIAAYANQRPEDDERQSDNIQWAEGQETNESALTDLQEGGYESRVYFGERSPSYSIVGKTEGGNDVELDLPKGERDDENQTTTYDGDGGVPIGGIFNKMIYALKFGEANLVLSGRVHDDSKILYDRDPRTMVEKVAPWLTVDSDPYPAVIDGKIQWILDGYTVTDRFPLSQRESLETMTDDSLTQDPGFQTLPTDEINYMRNAVKATVDAYDGTVTHLRLGRGGPDPQGVERGLPGRRAARSPRSRTRCWSTCATPTTCSRCSATSSPATTSPTRRTGTRTTTGGRSPRTRRPRPSCSRRTACSPRTPTARPTTR